MLKFGKSTAPVIEVQPLQPVAVIFSAHPLLGLSLTQTLQQQRLQTLHFPFENNSSPQNLNDLSSTLGRLDYLVLIYPHLLPQAVLSAATNLISQHQPKVLIIESFLHPLSETPSLSSLSPSTYQLVYLTNPYGPSAQVYALDRLSSLIRQALTQGSVSVSPDPKQRLYPTYVDDLLPIFTQLLFTSQFGQEPHYLSSLEPISELDFVNLLKRLIPEVLNRSFTIDFLSQTPPTIAFNQSLAAKTQSQLNWLPDTTLEQGIRTTLQNFTYIAPASTTIPQTIPNSVSPVMANPQTAYLPKETPSPKPSKPLLHLPKLHLHRHHHPFIAKFRFPLLVFFFLLLVSFVPPSLFLIYGSLGASHLKQAVASLEKGSPTDSQKSLSLAQDYLDKSRQNLQTTTRLYFFLPSRIGDKYDKLLDVGSKVSSFLLDGALAVEKAQLLYQSILGNSDADFVDTSTSLKADVESLYNQLSLLEVSLKSKDLSSSIEEFNQLKEVINKLPDLKNRLSLGISLLNLIPAAIGENKPTSYLLLLQNNAELRPTGGFLQSYAILSFQHGKLTDFTVNDFANADKLLSGHVDPPTPLKKHLTKDWYARDSNFDPDFQSSALQLSWFLQKELNQTFDGYFGLNLFTIAQLLKATGPLTLPTVNGTITADNLFSLTDKNSLIPQTSPDFHSLLLQKLIQSIKAGSVPLPDLARALDSSLRSTDLTAYLSNKNLQSYLDSQNWSGSLKSTSCPPQFTLPCYASTFSAIDANLGVNRVNQFVNRSISHTALLGTAGQLTHQIALVYQNSSPTQSWPGGIYKNYFRFYASNTAILQAISVNGEPLPLKDLDIAQKNGLNSYGFYFELPPGETKNIIISLKDSQNLNLNSPSLSLSLNWQKQSGTLPTPINLSLNYPSSLAPAAISLPAQSLPNLLKFETPFSQDLDFATQFKHL